MALRRSPYATAQLLLINAKLYEKEREREITRYRLSIQTLRRLSRRTAVREKFLSELGDELFEFGWLLIRLDPEFAVMDLSKTDSWVKLSSKRLDDSGLLKGDEDFVQSEYDELFPASGEELEE